MSWEWSRETDVEKEVGNNINGENIVLYININEVEVEVRHDRGQEVGV